MCLLKLHSIVYARPHCWQMNGDLTKSVKCKEKYYCQKVSSNRRATGQLVYREAIDFLTWMEVSNRPVNVSRVLRLRMNSQPSIETEHLFVDYYNETSKLIASLCQKIDRRRERGRKKFPDRDSIVYICSSKTEWNLYRETGINFRRRVVSVKCELHRNRETVIVIRFFSWGFACVQVQTNSYDYGFHFCYVSNESTTKRTRLVDNRLFNSTWREPLKTLGERETRLRVNLRGSCLSSVLFVQLESSSSSGSETKICVLHWWSASNIFQSMKYQWQWPNCGDLKKRKRSKFYENARTLLHGPQSPMNSIARTNFVSNPNERMRRGCGCRIT